MSAHLTASGTLVMPPISADPSQPWFADRSPIVPCPEPEQEDVTQVRPALYTPVPPAWMRQPLPSFEHEIAAEPVILPIGRARSAAERLRLLAAATLSLTLLAGAALGLVLL